MVDMHLLVLAAHPLVHVNASLNAAATMLLVAGLYFIKQGRVDAHKLSMLAAFAVSAAFLACYLYYHYHAGSIRFTHAGAIRYAYYAILLSHVVLAFTVPFLASWTIYLGLRATGCCSRGDCPLFSAQSATNAQNSPGEKGNVPLDPLSSTSYVDRHRRLARWTFPIWLYVSVTGVVVYVMLYHLWPPIGP